MTYKLKRQYNVQKIPIRCAFCGIGIGISTVGDVVIRHDCKEPFIVEVADRDLTLCEDCYKSYQKAENKESYIDKLRIYEFI